MILRVAPDEEFVEPAAATGWRAWRAKWSLISRSTALIADANAFYWLFVLKWGPPADTGSAVNA